MNMNHYRDEWVAEWCQENGWTDLIRERCNNYWAFPPGAVMPEPIPGRTLKLIKAQKGLSPQEKWWSVSAAFATVIGVILSVLLRCPMPLVFVFAVDAVTVAQLEVEDV
jgi:hypothetical protein